MTGIVQWQYCSSGHLCSGAAAVAAVVVQQWHRTSVQWCSSSGTHEEAVLGGANGVPRLWRQRWQKSTLDSLELVFCTMYSYWRGTGWKPSSEHGATNCGPFALGQPIPGNTASMCARDPNSHEELSAALFDHRILITIIAPSSRYVAVESWSCGLSRWNPAAVSHSPNGNSSPPGPCTMRQSVGQSYWSIHLTTLPTIDKQPAMRYPSKCTHY